MITLYIVVLLVGACHCNLGENRTDGNATEPASVQGVMEIIVTDPPSAQGQQENVVEPTAAQNVPEGETVTPTSSPTETRPPIIIPPVVSIDDRGTPPEDCSNYSPGDNATSFRVLSGGVSFEFNCVTPLIWSQANCRCEAKPVIITDPDCPHHRPIPGKPTQFQKRARGEWVETPFNCPELLVWDQSQCRCEWGPGEPRASGGLTVLQRALASGCFLLMNATFDKGIQDDSGYNRALGRQPWPAVTPEASVSGTTGGAARIKNGRVVLWFTGSNDLGTKLQIQIRFRVLNTSPDDSERTLLSNAQCDTGARNIDITYRPSDQRYTVLIRTVARTHTYSCNTNHLDAYAFHFFDLVLYNNVLSLYVDEAECFTETSIESGLRATPCYMGLGGSDFDGYIDEAVFRRGCFVKDHRPGDPLK